MVDVRINFLWDSVGTLDNKNTLYQNMKVNEWCCRKDMILKVKVRAKPDGGSNYQH